MTSWTRAAPRAQHIGGGGAPNRLHSFPVPSSFACNCQSRCCAVITRGGAPECVRYCFRDLLGAEAARLVGNGRAGLARGGAGGGGGARHRTGFAGAWRVTGSPAFLIWPPTAQARCCWMAPRPRLSFPPAKFRNSRNSTRLVSRKMLLGGPCEGVAHVA